MFELGFPGSSPDKACAPCTDAESSAVVQGLNRKKNLKGLLACHL